MSRFEFEKGKPNWLLVRSDDPGGKAMDAAFGRLQRDLKGRVAFHRLDWGSKEAKAAVAEFTLSNPPSSVVTDARGEVVMKVEGPRSLEGMRSLLTHLSTAKDPDTRR